MKKLLYIVIATQCVFLSACGGDSATDNAAESTSQEPVQSNRGVLTNQQESALDAARTVEQTLLDAAADREKELAERLRQQ
jgi:hypothetical protein